MAKTDEKDRRNPDRGIGAGEAQLKDKQRDVTDDSPHMPRHWQDQGTRGEAPGQHQPGPDQREVARGNQYGQAGEIASRQVHDSLTEHGERPAPQRREAGQVQKDTESKAKREAPPATEDGRK